MIKPKKTSKFKKAVAIYLAMMILLETVQPMQMYALTSGPSQPEFNAFTPIGTSDMVDLASGDFNYNIPIMDVGGYPLNLSYASGITMDQEASWVGLGWNLNVGQIERQVRGLPDDFNGDEMIYENNLKKNITVGTHLGVNVAFAGTDSKQFTAGLGLGVEYNNYEGISFKPSFGVGFNLSDNVSVGLNFTSSVTEGATVNPSVSISQKLTTTANHTTNNIDGSGTIGLGINSRKGVENLNLSASVKNSTYVQHCEPNNNVDESFESKGSVGGSISFNNQSFTPSKRIGFNNYSFSFNGAIGLETWFLEPQVQITGYGSYQEIAPEYKYRIEKAFGYEYTEHKKSQTGILDFNRENEKTVTENTTSLPVTNYTYDTYNIEGQGVSGMFRPYRSKVSYVYNDAVVDRGTGISAGAEFGVGALYHGGYDFKKTTTVSSTDGWVENNNSLKYLSEKNTDKKTVLYEPVSFRLVGSKSVDPEISLYDGIQNTSPLRFGIGGVSKSRTVIPKYFNESPKVSLIPNQRTKRFMRNQLVQKITYKEALKDPLIEKNPFAELHPHHTAAIKVLQNDGTTYVYGTTVYNTKKIEATFDVSGKNGNNTNGLVSYDATLKNNYSNNSDQYLNKITTNAYAHSYLLTSVLSSDYQDIDDNGPTINDLGSYTKFDYVIKNANYKWRIPYGSNQASYNGGLISKKEDQKGTYIYGEKELKYLTRIITKTHVAFFDLDERKDGRGALGENGGLGASTQKMYKIKSIRLYALPEVTNSSGVIIDPGENGAVKPIKTAFFVYNYSLCKGMPNNDGTNVTVSGDNAKGKLTLAKVYFTYRGSQMGKYTPYVFDYDVTTNNPNYDADNILNYNPAYNPKGFDIWGNYKINPLASGNSEVASSPLSTAEFPFVEQNTVSANLNTGAWTLKMITLPSGGKIAVETESDDYQYVQNKKAMQMFKVLGCGDNPAAPTTFTNQLYGKKYLYVKLDNESSGLSREQFVDKYLRENYNKPIQFRFLLNMTSKSWQKEYVSGYFKINENQDGTATPITITYPSASSIPIVSIPLEFLKLDGGVSSSSTVNPIAKAGWGFGRTYLNREVYSIGGDSANDDFSSIVKDLVGSIKAISEIFNGPNKALQDKGCANNFDPNKSWIRLENPTGRKLGGGLRVKSIKLIDSWGDMLGNNTLSGTEDPDTMQYGQTYSYNDEVGKSSGVATFEPNSCAENPLVEPFYNNKGGYAENIAAPKENNYVEKPFGQNFFPAPRITYSRVLVKNLERKDSVTGFKVKKHATGTVVTEHYTSYDFPTKVSYTKLDTKVDLVPNDKIGSLIKLANIRVRNHLTMSQGYSIETNDMNGKIKFQKVYAEENPSIPVPAPDPIPFKNQTNLISYVEYKYNVGSDGNLDNKLTTINAVGEVETSLFGVDYDLINDFNESRSETTVAGFDANLATVIFGIFPAFVPKVLPKLSYHENLLRTAVTTKHVHKTGILAEKIAYDLGSTISTKNIAWDANTGEVILTQTQNEYNDNYYSFTYPAYWMYDGMGMASQNIGIEGELIPKSPSAPASMSPIPIDAGYTLKDYIGSLASIFHVGDELYIKDGLLLSGINFPPVYKLWIIAVNNNGVILMDRKGNYVNPCADHENIKFKVMRSGYRNQQSSTMSTIISMTNPIADGNLNANSFMYSGSLFNPRIINASAIAYRDFWSPQQEADLPSYPEKNPVEYHTYIDAGGSPYIRYDGRIYTDENGNPTYPIDIKTNPYLWNIKGNWKAEKSYSYLAGRNSTPVANSNNPRDEGFFNNFSPFYQLVNGIWTANTTNWTYANSVTKISPYGPELENKDALERYSAAQYGYNYKLPMAVASNSKYQQMGFEGFEEVKTGTINKHFNFNTVPADFVSTESHTGKNSLKVVNGQTKSLTRKLLKTYKMYSRVSCPVDPNLFCPVVSIGVTYPPMSGMKVVKLTYPSVNGVIPDIRNYPNYNFGNLPQNLYKVEIVDNIVYVGFNSAEVMKHQNGGSLAGQPFYTIIDYYMDGTFLIGTQVGCKVSSDLTTQCPMANW
nr:hypothetical protein [uncultured Flavobacterium sp.]